MLEIRDAAGTKGTIKLEDMWLFAKVAEAQSFTAAARHLNMPKQTLSRRVAELERALGVQLLRRTTRRLHLTQAGSAYASRCADIVRAADEANRAVSDEEAPSGTLRITADPVFGEAFLTDLIIEYAQRWPRYWDFPGVCLRARFAGQTAGGGVG